MSDSDIFLMSSNRLKVNKVIIIENVRFKHFCEKMWALLKWCVTKVAHCISTKLPNQCCDLGVKCQSHIYFNVSKVQKVNSVFILNVVGVHIKQNDSK